ncbi:hypothetical protein BEST7613_5078 [Synechocystis sp. PCC 6803]|nr:hypothetical protein BEST7613_5078 [Synechocystis sp. PCC 6803] [Bacillus subtilis BEST7613]
MTSIVGQGVEGRKAWGNNHGLDVDDADTLVIFRTGQLWGANSKAQGKVFKNIYGLNLGEWL